MTDAQTDERAHETSQERPRRTWSEARRKAQEQRREQGRRPAPVASLKRDQELVAEAVVGEAVANLKGLAGLVVMPMAPYTGVTITGVPASGYQPGPDEWMEPPAMGLWLVASRADMMGRALLPQAQRNPRLLAILDRINSALRSVEVFEAAAAIAASAAVDAHVVEPDLTVQLPGGVEYPVLETVIGDTIAFVRAQQPVQEREARREARQRRATESDEGVQVPGQPWTVEPGQAEPTSDQLAAAHALREARAARAAGTERREGQVVIPGGVEDT